MLSGGPVLVMEMPEQLNSVEAPAFMQELQPLLDSHRPRLVFDCSQVRHIDGAGAEMVLYCLEEAIKRDGDLKFAALSPESEAALGIVRRFETFATWDEAVRNFDAAPAQVSAKSASSSVNVFRDVRTLKRSG